jgi:hypothetical protein
MDYEHDRCRDDGSALHDASSHRRSELQPDAGVRAGDLILKPTKEHMEANLIQVFQNKIKILISHLKESDAAILGASALAWD